MIFASRIRRTLNMPADPDHTVTIQKLNGRKLQRARDAFMAELVSGVAARGGAKAQKELMDLFANPDLAKQTQDVKADPLNGYDQHELVKSGLIAWSYDVVMDDDAIDDIDEDALKFIATEVLRLSKPELFDREPGETRKNAAAPSGSA